ncbi:hypothetical protein [Nostoc sp. UHCC 0870]|uniref:hypothetical protein n=1 Tax=Nostoc sp. UHCC 0870 TaxID=2914041 RepID=UPI001EE0ED7B|nr:hypothetical protein [Nostoc sp. UHCC 0870]UKO98445.1 hypothetical protein L6494_01510 [Nostoc sp. UHCC 0870]
MNSFLLFLTSLILVMGYGYIAIGLKQEVIGVNQSIQLYIIIVLSLINICLVIIKCVKKYQDIFNPLLLFVTSVLIRAILPTLLLLVFPPPEYLAWMNISNNQWLLGGVLAILAIMSFILGWLITPKYSIQSASKLANWLAKYFSNDRTHIASAVITTLLGILLMLLFYATTGSSGLAEIIQSGSLRATNERESGTYRFAYLAIGILYCSGTFLCAALLKDKSRPAWRGFRPCLIATLLLLPTGGRIVSLNPLIFGLTAFWYIRLINRRLNFKKLIILLLSLILFLNYSFFLINYRTGLGISYALSQFDWSNFISYFESFFWADVATLPVYALSATHIPGAMEGSTYPLILGTLLKFFFQLSGEVPGVFLIQDFFPLGNRVWGPHTGIFVDLYLNTGIIFAIMGCAILGLTLRVIYEGFSNFFNTPIIVTIYALVAWSFYWIFFESIMSSTDNIYRIIIVFLMQYSIFILLPKYKQ